MFSHWIPRCDLCLPCPHFRFGHPPAEPTAPASGAEFSHDLIKKHIEMVNNGDGYYMVNDDG